MKLIDTLKKNQCLIFDSFKFGGGRTCTAYWMGILCDDVGNYCKNVQCNFEN